MGIHELPIGTPAPPPGPWLQLAPSIVLLTCLASGLIAFWIRTLVRGTYRDEHLLGRGASGIAGSWVGHYFAWVTTPIWALVCRSGLPPNAITSLSVVFSVGSALAIARFSHLALTASSAAPDTETDVSLLRSALPLLALGVAACASGPGSDAQQGSSRVEPFLAAAPEAGFDGRLRIAAIFPTTGR